MKKLTTIFLIFLSPHLFSQQKLIAKASNNIKSDMQKVVGDYYDHFHNIKGEKLSESVSTIEYQSKVVPPDASESIITEIKSLQNVYSWEATLLKTDDFEKAVEKYRQIYRQLDGASFKMYDKKSWKFKGAYDTPDESRAFASSILEPEVAEKVLQRLKIEVALNYNMSEWTIKLLVYEKEADDEIRPTERTGL
ncbi:MAG: hypothetical protein ABIY62_09865 [Ginsengibacter sp.]